MLLFLDIWLKNLCGWLLICMLLYLFRYGYFELMTTKFISHISEIDLLCVYL